MALDEIKLEFENSFNGTMTAPNGSLQIGTKPGEMRPYHLLFGALGSCFYSTFLGIAEKKKLTFDGATITINGSKRQEQVATLEYVQIKMVIKNPSDEKQMLKCVELGAKYCSIHETISKVAKIEFDVVFE